MRKNRNIQLQPLLQKIARPGSGYSRYPVPVFLVFFIRVVIR